MNKKEKEVRRQQEDKALNRALWWAGGAIVLEFLLLMLKRYYIDFRVSDTAISLALGLDKLLRVLRLAAPVAGLLALVWLFLCYKKKQSVQLPGVAALVCVILGVCAHVAVAFREQGLQMLFLMVPVLAGVALVYYLYQKELFLCVLSGGLAVLGMWFVRYRGGFGLELALVLVGIALVLALTLLVKKQGGRLPGSEVEFLPEDTNYKLVLGTILASLLAVVLSVLMGGTIAYYLIFAMVALLFVLLVYYTVKLM